MTSATWADLLAQAIFHTLVASLYVEALVRTWRAHDPGQRIALRLTALGYPLVLFPALVLLFPLRGGEGFREDVAIFVGRSWQQVRFLGAGLFQWWTALLAALGLALLLMDLVPFLARRRGARPSVAAVGGPGDAALAGEVAALSVRLGIRRPPPVVYVERGAPLLFCTGVRRTAVVVSRGAVALLDPQELRAALAHELAHLSRRDPAASWVVLFARVAMWFNPAFQVVARVVARDAEWLADERAAEACGDRLALASGLLKLHRATSGTRAARRTLPLASALSEPLARVRSRDIEVRCRRLLEPPAPRLPFGGARVALATLTLTALLFFVV
jgi:Zn-dependent protease with chaperone function